jgi:hypothetical protein
MYLTFTLTVACSAVMSHALTSLLSVLYAQKSSCLSGKGSMGNPVYPHMHLQSTAHAFTRSSHGTAKDALWLGFVHMEHEYRPSTWHCCLCTVYAWHVQGQVGGGGGVILRLQLHHTWD